MSNFNNPRNNSLQKPRITHSPIGGDHYDIHFDIAANGQVTISKPAQQNADGVIEFDEITIPAALVIRLYKLLDVTRNVQYAPHKESEK